MENSNEFLIENGVLKKYNGNEEDVIIPDGVTRIDSYAFSKYIGLKTISLPEGVTSIGDKAFYECKNLTTINLPESVTSIGDDAFYGCKSLTTISLPEGVTSIGKRAFYGCESLTTINLPESVTSIGDDAFYGCKNLTSVSLQKGIKVISGFAFFACYNLTTISLPQGVTKLGTGAFNGCGNLTNVKIPNSVTNICDYAFGECRNLTISIPNEVKSIANFAFFDCEFKYIYFSKDSKHFTLTNDILEEQEKSCIRFDYTESFIDYNYRNNFINLYNLKKAGKIKFIPPEYTLKTFPASQIEKYFVIKNNQRWAKLVKTVGFDTLKDKEKINSLTDLLKIYYAIGGFSENQGESERAYEYIVKYVANPENGSPEVLGEEIHRRFSALELKGEYNKTFAQFFMKYYKNNPDFMWLRVSYFLRKDYLCMAHNNFNAILKAYPNRVVNGNEERALLTPQFVAEHCSMKEYEDVNEGNESLAEIVGRYGYSQEKFEQIQNIYEKAKNLKDNYFIMADKADETKPVTFRILEKDDPLGFVLGDITNCCQHIGGAGESCVDDGYTNPNAGFLVFEESIMDENNQPTGETRILGQAYVWYDPKTKTVCYDNIEIPTKVLDQLRFGDKHDKKLSTSALLNAVERSADAIMSAMNRNGVEVERVSTGEGYNDLREELSRRYQKEANPQARHRSYSGYTDADEAQYIIKTRKAYTLSNGKTKNKVFISENTQFEENNVLDM